MPEQARVAKPSWTKDGERPGKQLCWAGLTGPCARPPCMDSFIASRAALDDACRLMAVHGDDAGFEAALLAEMARDRGNVLGFCHWRQIERVIATLAQAEPVGTVH